MNGCLKYGGVLMILVGVIVILAGLGVFGTTVDVATGHFAEAASDAEALGTGIGASIMTGLSGGIGCVGAVILLIGILAYYAGNSGMQRNKQIKQKEQELGKTKH